MTDAPFLDVREVGYSVSGGDIIAGVSFDMRPGELRAVIGPNGAGKSTLARCLAGVLKATAGEVLISGTPAAAMSRRRLAANVCYMPQFHGDLPAFSVREYVLMARYAHAGFWRGLGGEDNAIADAALAMTGTGALSERPLPTLSGGERQLVSLAAGVAQEARLLILDEPATFLDPGHQDLLLDIIGRLNREQGISFLVVTHDVNMAMLFTHRTLALKLGRVAFDGPSAKLADDGVLRDIFDMEFEFARIGDRRLAFSRTFALHGNGRKDPR